jgi:superfamily II DNA or RNA helicase
MFNEAMNEVTAGNNASEQQAIDFALNHQLTLITGPPGTGKTKTIIQLMELFSIVGRKVLVVAPSNSATELNADQGRDAWKAGGYPGREMYSKVNHCFEFCCTSLHVCTRSCTTIVCFNFFS